MAVDLDIDECTRNDYTVIGVGGEIDVYTAPRLREKLDSVLDSEIASLCVDLTDVNFLDSTGLGVLVGAMKRVNERGGRLLVVCARPHILKVFEVTGLTSVFDIRASIEEV